MSKKTQRSHIGRCIRATGSLSAGVLLYRMLIWKPTIEHDGRLWNAKSREWLVEDTGLTMEQVKDALKKLRDLGFILTSQHMFGGKNVNHVLVTEVAENALLVAA